MEWTDQNIRKRRSAFEKGRKGEDGLGNNTKKKQLQQKKNAATFEQRQVSYFDFEQQPIVTESLNSLLHPVEEHDIAKTKKRKK